jgi:CHASE2 domain-containing sensor protein
MNLNHNLLARLGVGMVLLHLLIVTPHSIAHTVLHIEMNSWQNIYILLVILLAPILSALLLWKRSKLGFILLTVSMAASFVFGVYYHFIAVGPDNVASLHEGPWATTFSTSAVLLAAIELFAAVVGLVGARNKIGTQNF